MWNNHRSSGSRDFSLYIWLGAIMAGLAVVALAIGLNLPTQLFTRLSPPLSTPTFESIPEAPSKPAFECNGLFPEFDSKSLKAGDVIQGPASIIPRPYSLVRELGQILHLEVAPQEGWGLNIYSGQSVQIPARITLSNGQVWVPRGEIWIYSSDAQLRKNQQCWLSF